MSFSLSDRSSGVLLHLSSLPGPYYNGDLGSSARDFVDFLHQSGQRWWQMLPVNPIGAGFSPYSTISCFAGEPLFISLDQLIAEGWLKKSEVKAPKENNAKTVNYTKARKYRTQILKIAVKRALTTLPNNPDFLKFRKQHRYWLDDYALFRVICDQCKTPDWHLWPEPLRDRKPEALREIAQAHVDDLYGYMIEQYWFYSQWTELKQYATKNGIGLIGDLPIFVSHASADVWAHREFFRLGTDLKPTVVAGCPPDAFNKDGQLWGNALYHWPALEKDRFSWWIQRLGAALYLFDVVRLDHFIGFYRYWEIKAGSKTAKNGKWIKVPGDAFFATVTKQFKNPQFIAEDLGAVTPEIRALRDKYHFPGMKVSQFAFDGTEESVHHVPHLLPKSSVAYTGTHDNNTTKGWFQDLQKKAARQKAAKQEWTRLQSYLETSANDVSWDLIRSTMASQAAVTVFPIQDLLSQGGRERMNIPGVAKGNWRYRVEKKALTKALAEKIASTSRAYTR